MTKAEFHTLPDQDTINQLVAKGRTERARAVRSTFSDLYRTVMAGATERTIPSGATLSGA